MIFLCSIVQIEDFNLIILMVVKDIYVVGRKNNDAALIMDGICQSIGNVALLPVFWRNRYFQQTCV